MQIRTCESTWNCETSVPRLHVKNMESHKFRCSNNTAGEYTGRAIGAKLRRRYIISRRDHLLWWNGGSAGNSSGFGHGWGPRQSRQSAATAHDDFSNLSLTISLAVCSQSDGLFGDSGGSCMEKSYFRFFSWSKSRNPTKIQLAGTGCFISVSSKPLPCLKKKIQEMCDKNARYEDLTDYFFTFNISYYNLENYVQDDYFFMNLFFL